MTANDNNTSAISYQVVGFRMSDPKAHGETSVSSSVVENKEAANRVKHFAQQLDS